MKLYYFNPENDIALGMSPGQRLTMSPAVAGLHNDGALLPIWYASPGDAVLACISGSESFLVRQSDDFGLDVKIASKASGSVGMPWGWSFESARILSEAGAEVPDDNALLRVRDMSHRRITVAVMSRLGEMVDFVLPPVPCEIKNIETAYALLDRWKAVYVKQPWSSSGRGVFRLTEMSGQAKNRIAGMIRRQGSVMVERAFDKKMDFAMLFRSEHGKARYAGYSLFFNVRGDSYGGNLMTSDEKIEDYLVASGADRNCLDQLKVALADIFTDIVAPCYNGYFGVDMMLGKDGAINPCVEVNLRMTMGVVAHVWRERFLEKDVDAIFSVAPSLPDDYGCCDEAVIINKRLRKGRVYLTPPSANGFNFTVTTLDDGNFVF